MARTVICVGFCPPMIKAGDCGAVRRCNDTTSRDCSRCASSRHRSHTTRRGQHPRRTGRRHYSRHRVVAIRDSSVCVGSRPAGTLPAGRGVHLSFETRALRPTRKSRPQGPRALRAWQWPQATVPSHEGSNSGARLPLKINPPMRTLRSPPALERRR